ncbi:MAG: hypothetical protein LBS52_04050 [Dysgonamonadaceae bacterium]|nr:hypothetical protein [Dysgonamonadaceae bacterium]
MPKKDQNRSKETQNTAIFDKIRALKGFLWRLCTHTACRCGRINSETVSEILWQKDEFADQIVNKIKMGGGKLIYIK